MTAPPATPRPAATAVLVREGPAGPEVLLLRRNLATRFAPGAYVFPGGAVDMADGDAQLAGQWDGLTPEAATARLRLPAEAEPAAIAYYGAAVRETLEETGLLVAAAAEQLPERPPGDARTARPGIACPRVADDRVAHAREALLAGNTRLSRVLTELRLRLDGNAIEYIAHWVTPADSPARYDTRFFAVKVAAGSHATWDKREMSEALWLTPGETLDRHRAGRLPMIYPTLYTLRQLHRFDCADAVLSFYRNRRIPRIQPDVFRTAEEVRLRVT